MTYSLSLLEVVLSSLVLWILSTVDDMGLPVVANWIDDMLFSIVVDSVVVDLLVANWVDDMFFSIVVDSVVVDLLAFFLTTS